jgi:uncharacterized protein (DUF1330 family)
MPVYMIVEITVKAAPRYAEYIAAARPIVERFGGRYVVRGGPVISLFGDWVPERIIVIEFPSAQRLRECFGSPEYQSIAPLRQESTVSRAIVVEGCLPA